MYQNEVIRRGGRNVNCVRREESLDAFPIPGFRSSAGCLSKASQGRRFRERDAAILTSGSSLPA
jgi:hypothetical protein